MAYANAHRPPDARAIAGAAALQLAIGALVVTGLSNVDLPFIEPPKPNPTATTYKIPTPPPKPPEATNDSPLDKSKGRPTTLDASDPVIDRFTNAPTVPNSGTVTNYGDMLVLPGPATTGTPGPAVTPSATPSFKPLAPAPRTSPSSWFSTDDYPSTAARRELEGTVGYRLTISATGKVENCTVTRSSGHSSLDRATCQLLPRSGKFTPARNAKGENVGGTYNSEIVWRLP
ncbi:energy transducer TonB [Pseudoblastomonas halimionae]|uniref:TonB family protein n=1 Tax=Alteriqipengyuania halimionae TaxID=1926630 RepID=A0A6I4U1Y3_9SPHN|nr:energy transducer TonB [Alteriqipengyuania halimionae]MXP10030.1 TonB family protein [Alteriqipengyuania halimionae]